MNPYKPNSPFLTKEDEASYVEWAMTNANLLKSYKKTPKESLEFLLMLSNWHYDRVNLAWDDSRELLNDWRSRLIPLIKEASFANGEKRGQLVTMLTHMDAIFAKQKRDARFPDVRQMGVEARQKTAKENWAKLDKAIDDLFAKTKDGSVPQGFIKTNPEIAQFIFDRFPIYKKSTIENRVKKIAATHRNIAKLATGK